MKISELIKELKKYDQNLSVGIITSPKSCSCNDEYCYCSDVEDEYEDIGVDREETNNGKKVIIKKIWLRGI